MKHSGPNLKRSDYTVAAVSAAAARDFIAQHHYSKSSSSAAVARFGMYRGNTLVGVALFMAQRKSAALSLYDGDHRKVLCLSRLAIAPSVPRNGASFMLARCTRSLRLAGYECLTTYADSYQGHTGKIYLAAGWEYCGTTPPREKWINDRGQLAARKQGRRWRTPEEMRALGYSLVARAAKHKYRKIL